MTELHTESKSAAWFHYPWAWLVVAIPVITVVAGFITFYLASSGRDSLVSDNYYREGLAINRQTDRLRRAAELGISAELDFTPNQAYMQIILRGEPELLPASLLLRLNHPTLQEHDRQLVFRRVDDSNRYRAVRTGIPPGRWHISLEPDHRNWSLQDRVRLPVGSGKLVLAP